jgi:hypothetical protein
MEVDQVRDPGDLTVARIRAHCHDRQSEAIEQLEWNVIKRLYGKTTWWLVVLDEDEAFEVAGLRS